MGMNGYDIYETFSTREAERLVLSALLQSQDPAARAMAAGLDASWFLTPDYAAIASAALRSFQAHGEVLLSAINADLTESKEVLTAGWSDELVEVFSGYVPDAAFSDALTRMKRGAYLRQFDRRVWEMHEQVFDTNAGVTLAERCRRMESALSELVATAGAEHSASYTSKEVAKLASEPSVYVPTGIAQLDEAIHGFVPGRVSVLAGRPSHGKTALGLELLLRMARRCREKGTGQVVYFSAEMSAKIVGYRLVASVAGVNSRFVMEQGSRALPPSCHAITELASLPFTIDDTAAPTTAYMLGRCMSMHVMNPVRLVVFDYLQYTGEEAESRRLSLDKALKGAHELAKRLDCPVIVLAQLNREVDKRGADAEPHLSDLKETGGAEEIAALVLMCYHEWTHWYQRGGAPSDEPPRDSFRLFVRKNTHGPLGSARLYFDRETGRFTDPNEPKEAF